MKPAVLFTLLSLAACGFINGQFTDVSEMLNTDIVLEDNVYGDGVSFYDFTGDGWDDLTIADGFEDIHFFINNNGQLEAVDLGIYNEPSGLVSMTLWADYDNDGDNDLLVTKQNQELQLWQNDGGLQFTNVAVAAGLEQEDHYYWGAAFCDVDHDGLLDLFIAKYHHPVLDPEPVYRSILYHNNGDGTFSNITEAAGIMLPPRTTFQPVFFDYNGDGWEDLFLVIDRQAFSNELYENNGDGTFTNVTESSNTGQHMCAMTGTIGDYDNDADLDIYVTNQPDGNLLLRNNGDETYTDVTAEMGVVLNQTCWGSLWIDYDNNTWQDLFVSITSPYLLPTGNQMFMNNQGQNFIVNSGSVGIGDDDSETYMVAMGDLNLDGYYDFVWNNDDPYPAKLYQNDGGDNHFLSVSLQGILANRNGIGSWIHCYVDGNHYVRFTSCGENFVSQCSGKEIFGLGEYTVVDSLVIDWNSGTHDVYFDVEVDQHLLLVEGVSIEVDLSDEFLLCPGDSIVLHADAFSSYLWSNGEMTQDIVITEPGEYSLEVQTPWGTVIQSDTTHVIAASITDIELYKTDVTCFGSDNGSVSILQGSNYQNIVWFDGESDLVERTGLGPGWYGLACKSIEGCVFADSALVVSPDTLMLGAAIQDVSCSNGNDGAVMIELSGGTPPYEQYWQPGGPENLVAGEYDLHAEDANGCVVDTTFIIVEPTALEIAITTTPQIGTETGTMTVDISGGVPPYDIMWSSGDQDTTFVDGLVSGFYSVIVTDQSGCEQSGDATVGYFPSVGELDGESIAIWPNPSADGRINFLVPPGCESIRIYDSKGMMLTEITSLNTGRVLQHNYPPGIYRCQAIFAHQQRGATFIVGSR
ncbi:MAG: VCBS repeat-containing protein [Flavobacteriales bacterium]|nr:VCBS repeat-containing protein [Flavobacteriales bacterium]